MNWRKSKNLFLRQRTLKIRNGLKPVLVNLPPPTDEIGRLINKEEKNMERKIIEIVADRKWMNKKTMLGYYVFEIIQNGKNKYSELTHFKNKARLAKFLKDNHSIVRYVD